MEYNPQVGERYHTDSPQYSYGSILQIVFRSEILRVVYWIVEDTTIIPPTKIVDGVMVTYHDAIGLAYFNGWASRCGLTQIGYATPAWEV